MNRTEEGNSYIIIVGDSNILFSIMDRTTRQKISKEIENLNNVINKLDLTDIYRTFYPSKENTFFSGAHGTFSGVDNTLGHKSYLNRFLKIDVI